ncbi:hypothetical protein ACF0H5_015778 [Mactra antiquata]
MILNQEVLNLLNIGAITKSDPEPGQFISTLFVVPKPNNKYRPIINLRFLNDFVQYNHFKQETFTTVLDIIQKNDFFCKIDLSNAYYSVSIHPSYRKYLKFFWEGTLYEYLVLPFGLSIAPYLFTKILKPVFAWFRLQQIRCCYYIDDSLNMSQVWSDTKKNSELIVSTLDDLGFDINFDKSVLIPTQRIVFFGYIIDSVTFKVFLPADKVQKIKMKAAKLLNSSIVTVLDLASLIGSIINAFHAVFEAQLHYRNLERDKIKGLNGTLNFNRTIKLSHRCKLEVMWWYDNVESKNGKDIRPPIISRTCCTDASLLGFGFHDTTTATHGNGRWTAVESVHDINYLELLAMFYALKSLYNNLRDEHISIQSDNVCAVSYINNFGGLQSVILDDLAKEIWNWCIVRNLYISAVHIQGVNNTIADHYSRVFSDSSEWMLKQDIFNRICEQFLTPDIDLFASRLNKRVHRFVSWFPDPFASYVDAFSISWYQFIPYLFPPFNLVGKVLNKLVQDKVDKAILVFPYWPSQPWFPLLLNCLSSYPVRIPRHRDVLTLPHSGEPHPLSKRLKLVTAIVSGNPLKTEEFRKHLQASLSNPGQQELPNSINMHGISGIFGTLSGLVIHFTRLK